VGRKFRNDSDVIFLPAATYGGGAFLRTWQLQHEGGQSKSEAESLASPIWIFDTEELKVVNSVASASDQLAGSG
jgi:hypothetical protein